MNEKRNLLKEKSFAFAIHVIQQYQYLYEERKEYVLSKQFLRSGTAIGALIREAQNAESLKDFIHKLSIAQKECDETLYWLDLMRETNYLDKNKYMYLNEEANGLLKMLRSAIITSKKNNL
jgi:four helix bundle protein